MSTTPEPEGIAVDPVEEYARAIYTEVADAAQARADVERKFRRMPDGSLRPNRVVIQDWVTLSPRVKRSWLDRARRELAEIPPGGLEVALDSDP